MLNLTPAQIQEARKLLEQGEYTKRSLARKLEVPPTTLWYRIYGRKRKTKIVYIYRRKHQNYKFTNIKSFIDVVEDLREKGLNSGEISTVFNVPIEEINLIWCKSL